MKLRDLHEGIPSQIAMMNSFNAKHMREKFPNTLNLWQYWLDHAKEYTGIQKGDWKMEMKQCYTNSATLALARPEDIKYMEGYFDFKGLPIGHAWVEQKGVMKDYTLSEDLGVLSKYHYYGIHIPTKLVEMATRSRYWTISAGALMTLQSMILRDEKGKIENIVRKEFGLPLVATPPKVKEKK
jgi:hypothetical protein